MFLILYRIKTSDECQHFIVWGLFISLFLLVMVMKLAFFKN